MELWEASFLTSFPFQRFYASVEANSLISDRGKPKLSWNFRWRLSLHRDISSVSDTWNVLWLTEDHVECCHLIASWAHACTHTTEIWLVVSTACGPEIHPADPEVTQKLILPRIYFLLVKENNSYGAYLLLPWSLMREQGHSLQPHLRTVFSQKGKSSEASSSLWVNSYRRLAWDFPWCQCVLSTCRPGTRPGTHRKWKGDRGMSQPS